MSAMRAGEAATSAVDRGAIAPSGAARAAAATAGTAPSATDDTTGAAKGATKGGKKKFVLAGLVVVVVLAGGYMVKSRSHPPVYKPGEPVPAGKVFSLGTLTVNTSDGHLVQAGIDLQLTAPAVTKKVETAEPKLTNAAIADVDDWTYAQLLTPAGRSALQAQLVTSFQQILGTVDGAAQQVSAVYFTSFVLQ